VYSSLCESRVIVVDKEKGDDGKTGSEVRGKGHRVVGKRIELVSFGVVVREKEHLVEW